MYFNQTHSLYSTLRSLALAGSPFGEFIIVFASQQVRIASQRIEHGLACCKANRCNNSNLLTPMRIDTFPMRNSTLLYVHESASICVCLSKSMVRNNFFFSDQKIMLWSPLRVRHETAFVMQSKPSAYIDYGSHRTPLH